MKKGVVFALFLAVGLSFVLTSCGGGQIGRMEGKSYRSGVWVDENTFRIAAQGAYPEDESNPIVKQEMARRAAIMNAKYQVLEKFAGAKFQGAAGMKNFRTSGIAAAEEVAGTIAGGNVYSEKFNEHGCEVVYEVKSPGLKTKVTQIKNELQ